MGRKHLIYISLNFQFGFEVPLAAYLPQWTHRGFEVLPASLPDTGSTNNAFQVVRVSFHFLWKPALLSSWQLQEYTKTDVNNFVFQPITASISIMCECCQAHTC